MEPVAVERVATLLSSGVGALFGGFAGAWLTVRGSRREQRAQHVRDDVDGTFDALRALSRAYRLAAGDVAGARDDHEVADLEQALRVAALRTTEVVAAAAVAYIAAGRAYDAAHEDHREGRERTAFDNLVDALVAERAAHRA